MRGYIRKRGDRSWQLVYDLPRGADGKRQQRYETVNGTKRQAEARLSQILDSLRRDRYFEPVRLTLAEYLDQFSPTTWRPTASPGPSKATGTSSASTSSPASATPSCPASPPRTSSGTTARSCGPACRPGP